MRQGPLQIPEWSFEGGFGEAVGEVVGHFSVLVEEDEGGGTGDAVAFHGGGGDEERDAVEGLIGIGPDLVNGRFFGGLSVS